MQCECGACSWVAAAHSPDVAWCARCGRVKPLDPPRHTEKSEEPYTRAQVLGWKRKAEAYDVLVECCERLSDHQDDGSPLVEAMLDAVIEAKRLREEKKAMGNGERAMGKSGGAG